MKLGEEIVLRPRFKIQVDRPHEAVLAIFEEAKTTTSEFIVTRVDDHVFIKIPKAKQHYWSPQLDLEILSFEEESCTIHGLFGPKPAVWTLFMFLHFLVATAFIGFGIWAYTNASLGYSFTVQIVLMILSVIAWFVLYFAGRMGKLAGKTEMKSLYQFLRSVLNVLDQD
ncbi:MAG: GTP-binding protein [Bacteroidota bacterium]